MRELAFVDKAGPLHPLDEALRLVREKADQVRFGTITLTFHEGRLTQMEVSEKKRFAI